MDGTSKDPNSPQHKSQAPSEAERFQRLLDASWPEGTASELEAPRPEPVEPHQNAELRHGQPFMGRAVFDFGHREKAAEAPPAATERVPCPLCGEPNRLRHAYCQRCGFRLPWAAQVEGLPDSHPRLNRIDQAVERAIATSEAQHARCRFCHAAIGAYDRRCGKCGRWLLSNWNKAALDAWQPDFDAWNFSQVRGFRAGCLSPIMLVLALALWHALT